MKTKLTTAMNRQENQKIKVMGFMSKNLLMFCAALAIGVVVATPAFAADTGTIKLRDHVPAVTAQLAAEGNLSTETNLTLDIGLPLRNREALAELIRQISDPASTNYQNYLTPEEFTERFGPTMDDYVAVINFARSNGLTVVGQHPNRMILDVSGNVGDIEKAFHVTLKTYQHPTEDREFYAPDADPSVPSTLPVQEIGGLSDFSRPYAQYRIKSTDQSSSGGVQTKASSSASVSPDVGSGTGGSYIGNDFRTAYVPGTALGGSGQSVALVQFDGYYASDIATYASLAGRTNIPMTNILLNGFSGLPSGNGGDVEVSLDIEMLIAMAPALAKIYVYEGSPYNFHPNDVLNRIATDNSARQVSCSWGWTGGPSLTTDQILQQMAVQGQTFLTASGDDDAYAPGAVDSVYGYGTPAASPYLTSVGGTTLTMSGTGAAWSAERVWNWGQQIDGSYVGSAGGYSTYYSMPSWQTNISMTSNGGSATKRNFPDVSLTADNVFVVASGGSRYTGVGGTSCAAPLWAGVIALVNQQAAANGKPSVGFINPAIYALGRSVNYTNYFHDITLGNNTNLTSASLYFAASGYDLCTGWGTPNGTNFINALAASTNPVAYISAPLPPYGTNLAALYGGTPNGQWELFVQDDTAINAGIISNGWQITLTTAFPVGSPSDVALTMSAVPSFISPGSNAVWVVTATNYGPGNATNILISDDLPAGATYVSAVPTLGAINQSGLALFWSIPSLTTNTGASLTLTLHPVAAGNYTNNAIVSSDTVDPNPDDDAAAAVVTVGTPTGPSISGGYLTNGTFVLTLTGTTGQTNIVQTSTNLIDWWSIYTNAIPFSFTDSVSPSDPMRFYRTILVP